MNKKADLHNHTTASDGKLSPKELVNLGKDEGLDIISITDHDSLNGLSEALNEGNLINVRIIPGIELSTRHNNESIHILGYFKDEGYKSPELKKYLDSIKEYRIKRGEEIIHNLKKFFDISISYDNILKKTSGIIARPHIAKEIIDAGYSYNWEYIFKNILGNKSPAYVPNKNISMEEGLYCLKSFNAFVSLAHPTLINNSKIEDLMKYNFDGIEGIYPLNKPNEELFFRDVCKRYNKIITAGSDYHGLHKKDKKHGYIGTSTLHGEDLYRFLDALSI